MVYTQHGQLETPGYEPKRFRVIVSFNVVEALAMTFCRKKAVLSGYDGRKKVVGHIKGVPCCCARLTVS